METYTSSQGPGDCVRVTKNPTQVAIATPTQWCQWKTLSGNKGDEKVRLVAQPFGLSKGSVT
jgi:hypothetical protein